MKRPRGTIRRRTTLRWHWQHGKDDKTLAELSEKFDVHASQIVQWKAQLLEGADGVFLTPADESRRDPV